MTPQGRTWYLPCAQPSFGITVALLWHYWICLVHKEKVGPKKSYHYLICLVHKEKVGSKKSYHYLICLVHKEKVGPKKVTTT